MISYLIGVDGGGSGTRAAIAGVSDGADLPAELARGSAGSSGLINGADLAWDAVLSAINVAFSRIDQPVPPLSCLAIGLGLAGVHNKQWAASFVAKDPGFALVQLETDAYTTLLGAHRGLPGAIIALGTGSVGEALLADGTRREVGGWGFPQGDEGGGAWLGWRAVNYAQQVMDGRQERSSFSEEMIQRCGGHRDALFSWLARAKQADYAQLAPLVFHYANQEKNQVARIILEDAAAEIEKMALALDTTSASLPIALCGSLAKPMEDYLPANLMKRVVPSYGDSVTGALLMITKQMKTGIGCR